jgi:AcrR family transcriptional regulator
MIPPDPMAVKQQPPRRAGRPRANDARGREAILDAAADVFTERGFRGATVDAILERAHLSKGTFYWHFESKDELVLAVLAERVEQPIKELIELLRSAPLRATRAGRRLAAERRARLTPASRFGLRRRWVHGPRPLPPRRPPWQESAGQAKCAVGSVG